ncbi:TPA: hypothetical protein ACH3X2_011162 [Trebouxia sp. C0005]|nr:MAG: hypothetical protein FRX49_04155 [Trebouxia sp. A1-2]
MVATVSLNAQSVVVITGSSRGLGLEFVRQLLDTTESHVVATARDPQKADALTALAKQQPDRLKLVALDTGDESSIKAAAKEVASLYSGVDLLINNAGIDEGVETPVLELDAATYEKILKVNVVGPYLVTRTFVPLLLKRNTRTVVQMSSGLGSITRNRLGMTDPEKNPVGNKWIAYNASKAALNMQSSVFANELKKDKFCVVSLEPGWVDTDMGGGNARKMGMEKAPTDAHHSISTMLKTIQQLSIKDSGEFLTIDGNKMDY